MENHDCFENINYNENSNGNGYSDYLICEVCKETFESHRYVCCVNPYPHLSDKIIKKLLSLLGFDFVDDKYGEVDIPDNIISKFPKLYTENSISVESKGSYFYEFSDNETYKLLEEKLLKFKNYCDGWCQFNN